MLVKKRKKYFLIFIVILLSLFFRFYHTHLLQYWSGDEEIDSAVVTKMIMENKIVLVRPNATLGTSQGSFFHIISVLPFLIFRLNPQYVLMVTSLLGVVTTILIFLLGEKIKDIRLGFIISFLYSTSFLQALYDRRWWPLSLNPILVVITLISLHQVLIKKKLHFIIFIASAVSFSLHADPSLGVILLACLVNLFYFRQTLFKNNFIALRNALLVYALPVMIFFVAPLIVFEVRHRGTIIEPLIHTLKQNRAASGKNIGLSFSPLNYSLGVFTNLLFPKSTTSAENYFCYICTLEKPIFSPYTELITFLLIIHTILYVIYKKNLSNTEKNSLKILIIFFASFFGSVLIYNLLSHRNIYHSHLTIMFPVIFSLIGIAIYKLTLKNNLLLSLILITHLSINVYSLVHTRFNYPLSLKLKLVNDLSKHIADEKFSLYSVGSAEFYGGGYRGLFALQQKYPQKSNTYSLFDWWYKAHGLYPLQPVDIEQKKIIVISPSNLFRFNRSKILFETNINNLSGIILDNSEQWFEESMLQ